MASVLFKFLIFCVLLATCRAEDSVLALDDYSFEEQVVSSGKTAFVKFFAPW